MWAWDDLKGWFYTFRLPRDWAALLCFDHAFRPADLALEEAFPGVDELWLGACIMPMGYLNAMG